ncbi:TraR/DksA C4-type zinc finger protein [Streptomyces sp. BH-SS-21]|uniref:TraR/DksA C4-type zinc finger protein n=1 Tax=Streptomyces liliiviolaceus TaxID=2823109 RepID=A0A941BF02_9ACTN|nr:TraR/DksA C4-type zinc finger protein [Streptomyces liliiviolaceus]MBQ0851144.1 TraR/DksA C4-type zinc finger protein [Streptomyces liliiviolaceus]
MVTDRIIDDRGTTLSADDLAALRENLHEQRLFRQEQLKQLRQQAQELPASDTHRADAPSDRRAGPQAEVRGKLAASARTVLADIEAALARMDQGCYGSCRLCQEPIDRARLAVVPQGRYCTRCQQVREAGR